jgi:hypothetical protein
MVETGWALELPAVARAQELAAAGEREAERRERARQAEQQERVAENAAAAEVGVWMAQLRGEELPDVDGVLARGREDTRLSGDNTSQRRHQAKEILRRYGLEDVITGGASGVVFDLNLGCLEPERDVAQRSATDFEDAEAARLVKRMAEDRRYIESISRSRSPFARRSVAARNEPVTCPGCIAVNATSEESFLIHHSDADGNPLAETPAAVPPDNTDRQAAEVERLMRLGYSWESAQLAVTPYGEAVR